MRWTVCNSIVLVKVMNVEAIQVARPSFVGGPCLIRYDTVTACPQKRKKSIALDAERCLRKQLKTRCKPPAFPVYPCADRAMIEHRSEVEY